MILSLKVGNSVAESLNSSHETEVSFEMDFEETENDEKSELDEELKQLHHTSFFTALNASKNNINYFITNDLYRVQYLEFSTPPPEVA